MRRVGRAGDLRLPEDPDSGRIPALGVPSRLSKAAKMGRFMRLGHAKELGSAWKRPLFGGLDDEETERLLRNPMLVYRAVVDAAIAGRSSDANTVLQNFYAALRRAYNLGILDPVHYFHISLSQQLRLLDEHQPEMGAYLRRVVDKRSGSIMRAAFAKHGVEVASDLDLFGDEDDDDEMSQLDLNSTLAWAKRKRMPLGRELRKAAKDVRTKIEERAIVKPLPQFRDVDDN